LEKRVITEEQLYRVSDAISRVDPNLEEEWGLMLSLKDGARTVDISISAAEIEWSSSELSERILVPAIAALKRPL
jgi:hypothetical protein